MQHSSMTWWAHMGYVHEDLRFLGCYSCIITLTLPEVSEELLGVPFVEDGSSAMFRNMEKMNKYPCTKWSMPGDAILAVRQRKYQVSQIGLSLHLKSLVYSREKKAYVHKVIHKIPPPFLILLSFRYIITECRTQHVQICGYFASLFGNSSINSFCSSQFYLRGLHGK